MQLALARSFLGPIDEAMPTTREDANGIKVSKGTLTILLFLLAQTLGAVWWGGHTDEKLNNVNLNMSNQSAAMERERTEDKKTLIDSIDALKKELQDQKEEIKVLNTYNHNLRERLAAKHVLN